jgi:3-hydroxymyristoyl/3-hydroxydecanoyl-(acyl carrier protein) dehydratase
MRVAATVKISEEHPAFAGHFPNAPVLPGVLLLDEILRALGHDYIATPLQWRIASAKFLKPVGPGEELKVELESLPNGSVRFNVLSAGVLVATGMLLRTSAPKAHDRAD